MAKETKGLVDMHNRIIAKQLGDLLKMQLKTLETRTEVAHVLLPLMVWGTPRLGKFPINKDIAKEFGKGGKRLDRIWFWSDGIKRIQESIDLLATPGIYRLTLEKIGRQIHKPGRFDFWRMVFENRNRIPKDELLAVWFDCLCDMPRSVSETKVETPDEILEFKYRLVKPGKTKPSDAEKRTIKEQRNKQLATSVLTNPLLIDNLTVRYRYCQLKKIGWEMLRHAEGGRIMTVKLPDDMRQAIRDDDLPVFCLNLTICGTSISVSLLEEIMRYGGPKIFTYLVEENMIKPNVFPLHELCCFIVTHFRDAVSIPLLTALEEHSPGLLQSVHDAFGRNLLWYELYNWETAWFHPNCRLTSFLLEHGCDPNNENHLGMSWRFVTDNLTKKQKTRLLEKRYKHCCFALQDEQPLSLLAE